MSDQVNNAKANSNANEIYGKIIVIKRTGEDSASFELIDESYTFGRAADCDIRIQLLSIAEEHAKICRNEHGQAVLVKSHDDCSININNMAMRESSRVLEHNDIITLVERSFRYQFTPEMLARVQLAGQSASTTLSPSGMIPLAAETPKKPSSLSASVFSVSELPSSPNTPKTPVPTSRPLSNSVSTGQSPMVSNVVDNEITTSPKLSPKVFKMEEGAFLSGVTPFNIVAASSLGSNVVSSTDEHRECNKENVPAELEEVKPCETVCEIDNNASETCESVACEAGEAVVCEPVSEAVICEPTCEPVTEPACEPACEPVTEPAGEVIAEATCDTAEVVCDVIPETVVESTEETLAVEECVAEAAVESTNDCAEAEVKDISDTVMESTENADEIVSEVAEEIVDNVSENVESPAVSVPEIVEETVANEPMICEQIEETVEPVAATVTEEECHKMDCEINEIPESMEISETTEVAESMKISETANFTSSETANVASESIMPACELENSKVVSVDSAPAVVSEMTVDEPVKEENNGMEGIEATEEVIEQQSDYIEAPKPIEKVDEEINGDNIEEIKEPEVETEMKKESQEINEENASVDATESPVTIEDVTNSNNVEEGEEESVPVVELPEEEAKEVEVLVESEELASVEIEATVSTVGFESKLASPKCSEETETAASSTSTPLRKSTRVHVTPAALESVKKQQQQHQQHQQQQQQLSSPQSSSSTSSKQRTSSRVTRSRVTTSASPKNRVQKRQKVDSDADEMENIDLSENSSQKPQEKKSKIESNTPVRRSTRTRVNQK